MNKNNFPGNAYGQSNYGVNRYGKQMVWSSAQPQFIQLDSSGKYPIPNQQVQYRDVMSYSQNVNAQNRGMMQQSQQMQQAQPGQQMQQVQHMQQMQQMQMMQQQYMQSVTMNYQSKRPNITQNQYMAAAMQQQAKQFQDQHPMVQNAQSLGQSLSQNYKDPRLVYQDASQLGRQSLQTRPLMKPDLTARMAQSDQDLEPIELAPSEILFETTLSILKQRDHSVCNYVKVMNEIRTLKSEPVYICFRIKL